MQDVERVAQLYPGTLDQQAQASRLTQWSSLAVTIPGLMTTTLFPAPIATSRLPAGGQPNPPSAGSGSGPQDAQDVALVVGSNGK